ncbi:MAG TPA: DUF4974 domain-containing protein [Pyrinomonadaceae bacterium]|nr:DUF4974 domain-containing protein [Pyrinomonadaceae bacterium]
MKKFSFHKASVVLMLWACVFALTPTAAAQGSPQTEAKTPADTADAKAQQAKRKATWRLRISRQTPQTFTLKAENAPLEEIAQELGRRLNVNVALSPVMKKRNVTVDFSALTLDAALRMLAPKPYVDYEMGGGNSFEPKVLAVYLYALNERPPDQSIALRNQSDAVLIEGDTEEGVENPNAKKTEEPPLKVAFARNHLSVKARKQPLSVVLYKIASEVGVPFELQYESNEIIDVDFVDYPLEQAMRTLSSSVRFYFRADLQNLDIQPLRIALVAPSGVKS